MELPFVDHPPHFRLLGLPWEQAVPPVAVVTGLQKKQASKHAHTHTHTHTHKRIYTANLRQLIHNTTTATTRMTQRSKVTGA